MSAGAWVRLTRYPRLTVDGSGCAAAPPAGSPPEPHAPTTMAVPSSRTDVAARQVPQRRVCSVSPNMIVFPLCRLLFLRPPLDRPHLLEIARPSVSTQACLDDYRFDLNIKQ